MNKKWREQAPALRCIDVFSVFIASFAFVLQMLWAMPMPLSYFSDKGITLLAQHLFGVTRKPFEALP